MTVSTKKLGTTIRRLRKAQGLTQVQVAAAVGVSAPNVSFWETGRQFPQLATFSRLAVLFGESMDSLMEKAARR